MSRPWQFSWEKVADKSALVLLVLGWSSAAISALIALSAYLYREYERGRIFRLSLCILAAALLLFVVRGLLLWRGECIRRRRFRGAPRPARDGQVAILCLVVLGLVAALVAQTQAGARQWLRRREAALRAERLQLAAADAARAALQRLARDADPAVDALSEDWAQPLETVTPDGIATVAQVVDENRFFDLNNLVLQGTNATPRSAAETVMDVLTLCGDFAPVERVAALGDWMDADRDGLADATWYLQQPEPYRPAGRIFYSLGETLYVRGMKPDLFARHERSRPDEAGAADLLDCLTVIPLERSQPVPVNINTAGREVLLALLGVDREDLVGRILEWRKAYPFRSLDGALANLDEATAAAIRPWLAVNSRYFRVRARAYAEGTASNLRVLARRTGKGEVEVLQWVF